MIKVNLINGYSIELRLDEFGLVHYDYGEVIKYYVQIIRNGVLNELEISIEEYKKLMKVKV